MSFTLSPTTLRSTLPPIRSRIDGGGGDVDEQVSSDTNKFVCVHGWHHQTYVLLKEQYSRSGSTQQSQKATRGELNRSVNLISVFWDEIRAKTGMS